jgi:hypothetical protein
VNESTIKAIQAILFPNNPEEVDGIWGNRSQAALDAIIHPQTPGVHRGLASSFADPADVRAFRRCKAQGKSDAECFRVGDNGIGCWGDDCSEGSGQSCALPPDDMIEKFGSVAAAKHAKVKVTANNQMTVCILKDRMPWKKNITNKAIIDLNPDAVHLLELTPPIKVAATWEWA